MPDGSVRNVTIFVSSPSDVMPERERAARVIDRLHSRFRERVKIKPVFFEDTETYYTADKSFQEQILDAGQADLVVSIFWSRLGSELPSDIFGTMPDGQPYPGGAVYELMQALKAKQLRSLPDILVYRKIADTGISVTDPAQRRLRNAQLDAFEVFWHQWFVSREGHFRAGFQTFQQADEFEKLFEDHLRAWLDEHELLGIEVIWRIEERGSPFRGLEPYEPQHVEVFFGREREVDRGRERLLAAAARGTGFLLVIGPSGAGKSSLARAGLVTRLTQPGDIEGVDIVRFALIRPGSAATPQRALADALFRPEALPILLDGDFPDAERLASALMGLENLGAPILRAIERMTTRLMAEKSYDRPIEARLVLLIDQFEELFSDTVTEPARISFVRLIAALARSGRILVVATLRSSSYGLIARDQELMSLKDAGAILDIAVPGPHALAGIVRQPAVAAGLVFDRRDEKSLDEELLAAADGNSDTLPLLGFTLQWLFEHRDGARLTFAAYDELGGLEGAIGRAAEHAFATLEQAAQAALPQLLRGLAEAPRRGGGLALRDMPLAAAPAGTPLRALADGLIAARVMLVHGEGDDAMLRLAHDAVLRGWERARDLTTKEAEFYRIREEVSAAEQRWRVQQRADLLLAPGLPLAEAQSLKATYGAELAPECVAFIDASVRKQLNRQRRGYALATVFGVIALAALGASALAWQQSKRADRNFNAAKDTINSVIFDLAEGLRDVEGMRAETARRILARADTAIGRLAAQTDNDPEVQRSQGAMYAMFSDTYLRLGDTASAAEHAHKATDIFRKLSKSNPTDKRAQHDLSVGLEREGRALEAQGNLDGALAAYRESLGIARTLAAGDPANAGWQRDVSASLNHVGYVLELRGDLDGALAADREGLDITRALSAEKPDNVERKRNVAVSLNRIGDVSKSRGDLASALAAFQEALDIVRTLSAADPGNTQWRRDMSVGLNKVGDVIVTRGDFAGALAAYREGLDVARALVARDPDNTQWRRDVAVGLDKIGGVLRLQNDFAAALVAHREELDMVQGLSAKDPGNPEWQRDVSVSLIKVGDLLKATGDLDGALAALRESLEIRRALIAKDPGNAEWQRDVSVSLNRVGAVLAAKHDLAGALTTFRQGLDIQRALAARNASDTEYSHDIATSLANIGDVLAIQSDLDGARVAYRECLDILRRLSTTDPENTQWQTEIVTALRRLAENGDDPRAHWAEALSMLTQLQSQGRLTSEQQAWIGAIEGDLAALPQVDNH